eukprot:scaffold1890_cov380-Prasinococcus_capsulatus_cf.AAC.8
MDATSGGLVLAALVHRQVRSGARVSVRGRHDRDAKCNERDSELSNTGWLHHGEAPKAFRYQKWQPSRIRLQQQQAQHPHILFSDASQQPVTLAHTTSTARARAQPGLSLRQPTH